MENNSLLYLPPDTIKVILLKLPINDIHSLCISNKELSPICNDDNFWMDKVAQEFPADYLTKLQDLHRSWRLLIHTQYERERMQRIYGSWKNIAYSLLPNKNIPVHIDVIGMKTTVDHNIAINGLTAFSELLTKIRTRPPIYGIIAIYLNVLPFKYE